MKKVGVEVLRHLQYCFATRTAGELRADMDCVGVAFSIIGTLNQSIRIINQLKKRYTNLKKLPQLCKDLQKKAANIYCKLEPLKERPGKVPEELEK